MILELADLRIDPAQRAEFEAAVRHGLDTVIAKAPGFQRYELQRCIESDDRYVLLIHWDTLEDHTVGFRTSPAHAAWRAIVGSYFAKPPSVEHFEICGAS